MGKQGSASPEDAKESYEHASSHAKLPDCMHNWRAVTGTMEEDGEWVVLEECMVCNEFRERLVRPISRRMESDSD